MTREELLRSLNSLGGISRKAYEDLCAEHNVSQVADSELGNYGDKYGNYLMAHYINDEGGFAIERILRQRRYQGIQEESVIAERAEVEVNESHSFGSTGTRYDEACDACGEIEEVDNETGLCVNCSPTPTQEKTNEKADTETVTIIDMYTREVNKKEIEAVKRIDESRELKIDSAKHGYRLIEDFGPYSFRIYLTTFQTGIDDYLFGSRWDFEILKDAVTMHSEKDFIAGEREIRLYAKKALLDVATQEGAEIIKYEARPGYDAVRVKPAGSAMTIKDLRNKIGLSQQGLSDVLGIPKRTIEDWESGKRTPPSYVEKLIAEKLERLLEEQ